MRARTRTDRYYQLLDAFHSSEPVIRGFLRRFVASTHDIDDICQETVTRSLEAARSRKIEEPGAFLFGIARNIVRKELDRRSRALVDFVEDFSADHCKQEEPSVEETLDERQRMLIFGEAVAALPPRCQRVFVLKKVFGYSHKEIAERLNISVSTVEKHVAAGLKRCADAMDNHKGQNEELSSVSSHCLSRIGAGGQRGE